MNPNKRVSLFLWGGGVLVALGLASGPGCASGPKVVLYPESKAFYEQARLVMTGEEQKIFNHLPDPEARKEFIRDFWDKRDPDPDTEANEFRDEFYRRIDYANKHFKEGRPGWKTDRGRIYIYMGPPDKFEEFFSHGDEEVRGSIIWWVYYNYELGIEFADETGTGEYRIRRYEGNFFEAMEIVKLGQTAPGNEVFRKRYVDFKLAYDAPSRSLVVTLPANTLSFKDEDGRLKATLAFEFFLYQAEGEWKNKFKGEQTLALTEEELIGRKVLTFAFPVELAAGAYYCDVVIRGEAGASGKIRKIFEIKVR
ncbi:MAG: GWxTD domain-containing protein [Candidatus Aminicenantes bacterium]|nr:GWxTD domain-containing protein [Candidatus Aminicenantes bacterium]